MKKTQKNRLFLHWSIPEKNKQRGGGVEDMEFPGSSK